MPNQQHSPLHSSTLGFALLAYSVFCLVLTIGLVSHRDQASQTLASLKFPATPNLTHRQAPDFASITDVNEKKRRFFEFLLPAIQQQNAALLSQRQWLKKLQQQAELSADEQDKLLKLAKRFRVSSARQLTQAELIDQLLVHMDLIPAALVLAQAANESAWGTSRFALEANNYFGQWCFSKGCGVVPKQRNDGAIHEVAKFKSADASVAAYFLNINRNQSYKGLRGIRAKLRQDQKELDAIKLAEGLQHYSSRGEAYIEELQSMIRYNKLQQYADLAEASQPQKISQESIKQEV